MYEVLNRINFIFCWCLNLQILQPHIVYSKLFTGYIILVQSVIPREVHQSVVVHNMLFQVIIAILL